MPTVAIPEDAPGESVLGDDELVEKAESAANGRKFRALFERGWESPAVRRAYDTHRCAELAIATHLVWWSRYDLAQVARLFRRSALYRGGWEEHPAYYRDLLRSAVDLLGGHCYDPEFGGDGDA